MTRRMMGLAGATACLVILAALVARQDGRSDEDVANEPVLHWVFDAAAKPDAGGRVASRVGTAPLRLSGTPKFVTDGATPALVFSGEADGAYADAAALTRSKLLPAGGIGIAAWVRVDRPEPPGGTGGLVGLFQNHFDADRGFLLGYEADHFTFGLAAESTVRR